MKTTVQSLQGDTVASLCYRHYGKTQGIVEQVLDANPTLATLGITLPTGTVVTMPSPKAAPTKTTVTLWG